MFGVESTQVPYPKPTPNRIMFVVVVVFVYLFFTMISFRWALYRAPLWTARALLVPLPPIAVLGWSMPCEVDDDDGRSSPGIDEHRWREGEGICTTSKRSGPCGTLYHRAQKIRKKKIVPAKHPNGGEWAYKAANDSDQCIDFI